MIILIAVIPWWYHGGIVMVKIFSLRLADNIDTELTKYCQDNNISKNAIANFAISRFLKEIDPTTFRGAMNKMMGIDFEFLIRSMEDIKNGG